MFRKILVVLVVGLLLTGCIGPDKNRAPTVAQVSCPETAKVGEKVNISVVATDRDRDRIAYKLAFGDSTQSEWSELLESGVTKTFLYTYSEPGIYGIYGIASDEHHKNSGWSEKTYIEVVKETQIGPERVMFCVGPNDDFVGIAALGITIIQSYELPYLGLCKFDTIPKSRFKLSSSIRSGISFLDRARNANLKVYYSIASMVHNQLLATGSWNKNDVAEIIEKCKDHPALYCWQPIEEANLPGRDISFDHQKDIYNFFKERDPYHPVTQTLAGGTSNWHKINFEAMDFLTPDSYVYNGTGEMWGLEPLAYLAEVGRQERTYLDNKGITKPVIFIMQCCDEPAAHHDPPVENSEVPLGCIESQFDTLKPYDVFTGGFGYWAWDGGFFGPETSSEMYDEIKQFLGKVK